MSEKLESMSDGELVDWLISVFDDAKKISEFDAVVMDDDLWSAFFDLEQALNPHVIRFKQQLAKEEQEKLRAWLNMKIECRCCGKKREERARGLCGSCYVSLGPQRRAQYALPRFRRKGQKKRCVMPGCEAPVRSKGLCQIHYLRDWRAKRKEKQCQDC